jgi:hypothetical protein
MLDQAGPKTRRGLQSGPLLLNSELGFRGLPEKLPAGAYTCDPDGLLLDIGLPKLTGYGSCAED